MSYYQIVDKKIFFSDRRMDPYYQDVYSVFELFDAIDGSYTPPTIEEFNRDGFSKKQERIELLKNLKGKADDCRYKAVAVRYSLALIEQEMSICPTAEDLKNYSEMIAHKMCPEAEIKNEVLIYETESFLFQVKSNLDILVQLLKHIYPYLDEKKGRDKESFNIRQDDKFNTVDFMRSNGDIEMADFFAGQIDDWIEKLNIMRNTITHRSGLPGFTSFVFKSDTEEVVKPKMYEGRDVDEYCRDIFNKLLNLYKVVAEEFVLKKL